MSVSRPRSISMSSAGRSSQNKRRPSFLNDKGEVLNLVPMIQRGKAPVALTTEFTAKLNERIATLIEQSSKLAEAVGKREVG